MKTINQDELLKFEKMADEWWDPSGHFKPLHKLNPTRIQYIRDMIIRHYALNTSLDKPLNKIKILDIGCGGGLMSEPFAHLGADVTGLDAVDKNIQIASLHAQKNNIHVTYTTSTVEEFISSKEQYDVVFALEIIEHVENPAFFTENCLKLVKKGGLFFGSTINRTAKSYILSIIGAEYIMNWLPKGTHQWSKFITPDELIQLIRQAKLEKVDQKGFVFNPLSWQWRLSDRDLSVNSVTASVKP